MEVLQQYKDSTIERDQNDFYLVIRSQKTKKVKRTIDLSASLIEFTDNDYITKLRCK